MAVGRIVVGVDGSPSSLDALRWALGQARLDGGTVEAVTAWSAPSALGGYPISAEEDWEKDGEQALDTALSEVGDAEVDGVGRFVLPGHPAAVLLDRAAGADLLVVGNRGHGGFTGMLLGSVTQHVVAHAPCPVVVVRNGTSPSGRRQ
jgi:nucleotide-binding universal stress UspA family protein